MHLFSRWRHAGEGQRPDHRAVRYRADRWRSSAQLRACPPKPDAGVCRHTFPAFVSSFLTAEGLDVSSSFTFLLLPRRSAARPSLTGPLSTPGWWSLSFCGAGLSCSQLRWRGPGWSLRPQWAGVPELTRCVTSSWARCLLPASPRWVPSAPCSRKKGDTCSYASAVIHIPLWLSSFPFSVDFSKPVSSAFQAHSSQFVAQSSGRAQVVLSWWDLDMDPSGSIVCTMAPSWTYQEPKMAPVSHWPLLVFKQPVASDSSLTAQAAVPQIFLNIRGNNTSVRSLYIQWTCLHLYASKNLWYDSLWCVQHGETVGKCAWQSSSLHGFCT